MSHLKLYQSVCRNEIFSTADISRILIYLSEAPPAPEHTLEDRVTSLEARITKLED
jgi:hypothetical protein